MIQLNYRDSKPIYEQIKEGLMRLLLTRAIDTDEKLPSVRELAGSLAINPNTIQRAYRELESEGYIYTVPGKGSFAAQRESFMNAHRQELFREFDGASEELLLSGVPSEELKSRIDDTKERMAAGRSRREEAEDRKDSGKNPQEEAEDRMDTGRNRKDSTKERETGDD